MICINNSGYEIASAFTIGKCKFNKQNYKTSLDIEFEEDKKSKIEKCQKNLSCENYDTQLNDTEKNKCCKTKDHCKMTYIHGCKNKGFNENF